MSGLSQLKDPSIKEATTGVVEPLKRRQAYKKYQYLGFAENSMVCSLSSVWALGQTVRHVCKGHALGPSAQAILVQSDEHGEIVLGKFEE